MVSLRGRPGLLRMRLKILDVALCYHFMDVTSRIEARPWSPWRDEICDGEHAVMLASATPAEGVVLTPVTNFGLYDAEAGINRSVNSSVGAWKKLDRIRRNPQVAL